MAQPPAIPRIRRIPAVGRNVPKEIAPTLSALKQAVDTLSGAGDLAAIRRAEFLKLLSQGVRVPGVLPPGGGGSGGGGGVNDDELVEQHIADMRKLITQAQLDVQGIYRNIEVNETLARELYGLAHENLGEITDHADELEEHANDLADHALELIDLATTLDALSVDFYDPVTGLEATSTLLLATVNRVDLTEDSIDVITAQITALESEIIDTSSLDPGIIWQFENDEEGWTSNVTLTDNSFYERIAAGASAYFRSPSGIAIDGRLYTRLVARIRRPSGTGWLGRASYATLSGHGIDTTNYHLTLATEPILAGGGWSIVVWDMELLTAGGTDWTDSTIDQIQLELSDDGATVFEVDWVAIGRIAPSYVTGVISALESRVTQTETDITALSSAVLSLTADVTDLEGEIDVAGTAIDTLDTRITVAEGDISANSTAITSLDLRLDDAESDITASASAITGLDTRLDSAEGTISSHSSQLTSLENSVDDLEGDVSANSSAITSLDSRVDVTETDITAHASRLTALEVSVDDPVTGLEALSTLVDTFDTRITAAEDSVDAFAFTLTALESQVDDLDAEVGGFATAISTLNTRVNTAESNVSAQASAIQLLQVRGGGVSANKVNPLDAAGYSSGWVNITNADVFNINIGGRNAPAARLRTATNIEVPSTIFTVEPNEILEVRFSFLKTVANGMVYFGLNAFDSNDVEVGATSVYNRADYEGAHVNPYPFYAGVEFAANTMPTNTWYDVVVYLLGNAVPASQCPAAMINNIRHRPPGAGNALAAAFPWVRRMVDGYRLPPGSTRARVRALNYYNTTSTDTHVNHVSVKRIDNQATAAVESEETARVAGDQANASTISTVSTTVNGHTASINTLTTSVNGISAQWVMQLDVNGRVTGLRLAGSPTFTSFTILADQFSVVMPGVGAVVPFTVGLVNGVPTVGITGNLVVDGTIVTRNILTGAISTTGFNQGSGGSYGSPALQSVTGIPISIATNNAVRIDWFAEVYHNTNVNPQNVSLRLYRNGILLHEDILTAPEVTNWLGKVIRGEGHTYFDIPGAGFHNYQLFIQTPSGTGSWSVGLWGLAVTELKR